MGHARSAHADLVHVRGWTRDQICAALETLRRKSTVHALSKEDFTRYFGGRSREAVAIFNDLDTDYDGRVDVFEVIVVLAVWSGTSWDDKLHILFNLFDMMGKGFLKVNEVMLLGTVLLRTLNKFVQVNVSFEGSSAVRDFANKAFPADELQLSPERFKKWANTCEAFAELRGFLEDYAARGHPPTNVGRLRSQLTALQRHATWLSDQLERLHDELPSFVDSCLEYVSSAGRRKRWDFLMQNLRQLLHKLQGLLEDMHIKASELDASLSEEAESGGLAAIADPKRRFDQEQLLIDLGALQKQSLTDNEEAAGLLAVLIDMTEPGEDTELPAPPEKLVESTRAMRQLRRDMLGETEDTAVTPEAGLSASASGTALAMGGAARGKGAAAPALGDSREAGKAREPVLVVVVDFDPPPTHKTQMLQLRIGDRITVLGQDGRGWWYGRATDGREGWFPPSYVQEAETAPSTAAS
mmetsp:Transcript_14616/g.31984  ORF Transcript_14616/g.31984 Transcript_14616/m.31984 type:complete len:469 (-) Transcript_14616:100-1506(-)